MANTIAKDCEPSLMVGPSISITSNERIPRERTQTELAVSSLPEIQLDTSFDWVAAIGLVVSVLAFFITAYIVRKSTAQQIKSYQGALDSQRRLVKAEILSRNRQAWIDSLRDATADFVAACLKISDLYSLKHGTDPANNALDTADAIQNNLEWCHRLHEAKSVARGLQSKVHLLANPRESDFQEMLRLVDDFYTRADDGEMGLLVYAPALIAATQKILKTEWDRVKLLEGLLGQA